MKLLVQLPCGDALAAVARARVKLTSIACSGLHLAVGANTGSVYLLPKAADKVLQILAHPVRRSSSFGTFWEF